MYVLPATFYTIAIVLALHCHVQTGKEKWSIAALIPCATFLSAGINHDTGDMCAIVGTIIFGSGLFKMCLSVIGTQPLKLACVGLSLLHLYSDSIFNYYITIPIVFALLRMVVKQDFVASGDMYLQLLLVLS